MKNPLLLLHGALGSQQQLQPLAQLLASNYSIHQLNFSGHGGRPAEADFSMDVFVNNVVQYLEENQLQQVSIFGYSMGGYVALCLALKHPHLVDKIVTLGTKFNWSQKAAAKEVKLLNPTIIAEKVPKFAAHLQATHAPNNWEEVLKQTAQMMLGLANGNKLQLEDLKQIQQEVCIGIGSLDNMVTVEESQEAAAALPQGTIQLLEEVYHPLEKNEASALVEYIQQFLS